MKKFIASLIVVLAFAGWANGVIAQTVTNGYMCSPKNPGGEQTRLFFRQQDGVSINLSQNATFPVVCPVLIPYDDPPYWVGVWFTNGSNVGQKFSCALEEYDLASNLVASTGKSVFIAPRTADFILYEAYFLENVDNNLSLRCIIPPRGMLGYYVYY